MESVDEHRTHTDGDDGSQAHAHAGHEAHHEIPMSPEEVVRSLLLLAQVALDAGDYESAVEAYASALQLEPNEFALYNLGSLYARGLGVRRNFMEAARLFHQAELQGNERAGKLCRKCMLDYIDEGFEEKTPVELYAAMAVFVSRVYPEATDQKQEVVRGLTSIAITYNERGERAEAEKALLAADVPQGS